VTGPVIAVDPGLMTGIACMYQGQHRSLELPYEQVGMWVEEYLDAMRPVQVVCENFFITRETAKKSQSPWSLKLIGVMDYLVAKYGQPAVVLQAPSDAKRFSTDARLKTLGWYKGSGSGYAGHADDASRHLLLYLAKQRLIDLGRIVDV